MVAQNNCYYINNSSYNNVDISAASDATTVESPAISDTASSLGGEGDNLEEALVAPWMDELFEFSDSHFDDVFAGL